MDILELYQALISDLEKVPLYGRQELAKSYGIGSHDPACLAMFRARQIEAGLLRKPKTRRRPTALRARYQALRLANGCCQLCGAGAKDGVTLCADHIKPVSKYPELEGDPENIQVLCNQCNVGKSNEFEDDWRG